MLLKQRPTNHFNRWTGHCRIFWRIYLKIKRFVGLWFDENKAKIWEELIENNCFPNYDDYHFQNHNHYDYEDDSLSDIWEKQFLPKMDTNGFYKLNGNHKYDNLSSKNLSLEKSRWVLQNWRFHKNDCNTLIPYWQISGKLIQSSIGEFWGVLENSSRPNVTYHIWFQSKNSNGWVFQ